MHVCLLPTAPFLQDPEGSHTPSVLGSPNNRKCIAMHLARFWSNQDATVVSLKYNESCHSR